MKRTGSVIAIVILVLLAPLGSTITLAAVENGGTVSGTPLSDEQGVVFPDATINGSTPTTLELAYNASEYVDNGTVSQANLSVMVLGPNSFRDTTNLGTPNGTTNITVPGDTIRGGEHQFRAVLVDASSTQPVDARTLGATAAITDQSPVTVETTTLNRTSLNVGEQINVTATLRNPNQTTEPFTVAVYRSGVSAAAKTVSVAPDTNRTVSLDVAFPYPGQYLLHVNNETSYLVSVTDSVSVLDTSLNRTVVPASDGFELDVTLQNTQDSQQSYTFDYTLFKGATGYDRSASLTVPANTTKTFTINGSFPSVGTYYLSTENGDAYSSIAAHPQGTTIIVEDVANMSATVNESTFIAGTAVNYGSTTDTRNVTLRANGTVLDNQTVTVGPGNETSLNFMANFTETGPTTVQVGNQTITVTVRSDPVVNSSVTYVSGPPLDANATLHVSPDLAAGLLQGPVSWSNNTTTGTDLAEIGATNQSVLRIELVLEDFDPHLMIGTGHDANMTVTRINSTHQRFTLTASPGEVQRIYGASLNNWPTGPADQADSMEQARLDFAIQSNASQFSDPVMEGLVIMTDADSFGTPEYRTVNGTKQLDLLVAGPHLTVTGDVNHGYYETYIPPAMLASWGITDPNVLTASYNGSARNLTARNTSDGGAYLTIPIHYSSGTVSVTKGSGSSNTTPSNDDSTDDTSDDSTNTPDPDPADPPADDTPDSSPSDAPSDTSDPGQASSEPTVTVRDTPSGAAATVTNASSNVTVDLTSNASANADGVTEVALALGTNASNLSVTVEDPRSDAPEGTPAPESQDESVRTVTYFNVSVDGATDDGIDTATIQFTVNRSLLPADSSPSDVVLLRYHDGEWQSLTTTWLGNDSYEAETPGFSTFAVATAAQSTQETTTQQSTTAQPTTQSSTTESPASTTSADAGATATGTSSGSVPGFGVGVTVVALVTLLGVLARRE